MEFPRYVPFIQFLGCQLHRFEDGEAELSLEPRPEFINSSGVVHGGVVMTMLDTAMGHAARSTNAHLPEGGPNTLSVEIKTTFMRPSIGRLRIVGRLLHRTKSTAFCEGWVYTHGDENRLAAHATGTIRFIARDKVAALRGELPPDTGS